MNGRNVRLEHCFDLEAAMFEGFSSSNGTPASPEIVTVQSVAPNDDSRLDLASSLEDYIQGCPTDALRAFLCRAFSEQYLRQAFLTLPASREHHHAWPGGLAEHSLEVATIVGRSAILDTPTDCALGSVAALLHDIGKVRTMGADGRCTQRGWVLSHDALTLEVLANGLRFLDSCWPDGATDLRYLLTWKSTPVTRRPLRAIAILIQAADQYSSACSARDRAFHGKTDWQRFAVLEAAGPRNRFWRPREYRNTQLRAEPVRDSERHHLMARAVHHRGLLL